jgi:hypothetical protein
MIKNFLKSKVLWTNLFFIIILFVQSKTGFVIPAEMQAVLIGLVNLVLRQVTKSGLTFNPDPVNIALADAKSPFSSKTMWINVLAIVALAVQHFTGNVLSLGSQAEILILINMALRVFTKVPISWGSDDDAGIGKIASAAQ